MPFSRAFRCSLASISLAAALCACQGDDNALPLPPDAGSNDGHAASDATSQDSLSEAPNGDSHDDADSSPSDGASEGDAASESGSED